MCYGSLVDDEAAVERPIGDLLGEKMGSAAASATVATAVVVLTVLVGGTPLWLVGVTALVTPVLTVLPHQAVLVTGVAVLRWWATREPSRPDAA